MAKKCDTLNKDRERPVSVLCFKVITEETSVKNADIFRANEIFCWISYVAFLPRKKRDGIRSGIVYCIAYPPLRSLFFFTC